MLDVSNKEIGIIASINDDIAEWLNLFFSPSSPRFKPVPVFIMVCIIGWKFKTKRELII